MKRVAVVLFALAPAFALAPSFALALGARDAGAERGDAGAARIPPDPPPLTERSQWLFDLRWDRNEVYLLEVRKTDAGGPRTTPRVMGRFALELYEGPTLIERARFDFPFLGAPEEDAGRRSVRFDSGLNTRIGVLFPATRRGTRIELWDRATDRRWPLSWPPREGVYTADAGQMSPAKIPEP